MRSRLFVVALAVAGSTVCVACGPADPAPAPRASVAAPSPTTTAGPATTGATAHGYVAGLVRSTGTDGAVTYDVQVPTISGGSAAVVERFTSSMRASLADRVRTLGPAPSPITVTDGALANGERSRVTRIGGRTVSGLLLTSYFMRGGAHPNNQIGTVVIDTATAQPILLTQVLPTDAAIARATELVRQRVGDGPRPSLDGDGALANWLPTDTGITFYVPTIHAAGDYWPVMLSWSDLGGIVPDATLALLRA